MTRTTYGHSSAFSHISAIIDIVFLGFLGSSLPDQHPIPENWQLEFPRRTGAVQPGVRDIALGSIAWVEEECAVRRLRVERLQFHAAARGWNEDEVRLSRDRG